MLTFLNVKLNNRVIGLDVMRSLAILIVLFGHYNSFFYSYLDWVIPFTNLSLKRFLYFFVTGFDGVDLFFVLSGFLIGHSILKAFLNNELTFNYLLHNFWVKRWFRTLPNYFFVLVLLIILYQLIPIHTTGRDVPFYRYFIFAQNIFYGGLSFFPESWSLSVEEFFYILFPIAITCGALFSTNNKYRKYILLTIILFFIIMGTLIRVYYAIDKNFIQDGLNLWNSDVRTAVIMRIDAIIYGVLMAFFKIYYEELFIKHRYVLLVIGLLILLVKFKLMFLNINKLEGFKFAFTYYFSFVGLGMCLLLPYFYSLKLTNKLLIQFFSLISVISYSLYLVNYFLVQHYINYFIDDATIKIRIVKFVLACLFTFTFSILLYKYIETPFMNIRKKILNEYKG